MKILINARNFYAAPMRCQKCEKTFEIKCAQGYGR